MASNRSTLVLLGLCALATIHLSASEAAQSMPASAHSPLTARQLNSIEFYLRKRDPSSTGSGTVDSKPADHELQQRQDTLPTSKGRTFYLAQQPAYAPVAYEHLQPTYEPTYVEPSYQQQQFPYQQVQYQQPAYQQVQYQPLPYQQVAYQQPLAYQQVYY